MKYKRIILSEKLRLLLVTCLTCAIAATTVTLYGYGHHEWCKPKASVYNGSCSVVDEAHEEFPCCYACPGTKTRTAYTDVGDCEAKYNAYCYEACLQGTYVEATGECIPTSNCNAECFCPSYGPDGPEQIYENPQCNP